MRQTTPVTTAQTREVGTVSAYEWTPPPKRQRQTPSTTETTRKTLVDDTDDSDSGPPHSTSTP